MTNAEYAPELPPAARARIEQGLAEGALQCRGGDAYRARQVVVDIYEVFVWEITEVVIRERTRWTAEKFRTSTETFFEWLTRYAQGAWCPLSVSLEAFRAQVRGALDRRYFWTNLQENLQVLARAEAQTEQLASELAPPAPLASETIEACVARRAELLAEFKRRTGVVVDAQIYNRRESIAKKAFYQWRDGTLLNDSPPATKFERFLRDGVIRGQLG